MKQKNKRNFNKNIKRKICWSHLLCVSDKVILKHWIHLRILTEKKVLPSYETPALTKSANMDIWVVGETNQLIIRGS